MYHILLKLTARSFVNDILMDAQGSILYCRLSQVFICSQYLVVKYGPGPYKAFTFLVTIIAAHCEPLDKIFSTTFALS